MDDWTARIRSKLDAAFAPQHLEVYNDSAAHHGHAGSPGTGNSHFRVVIESAQFAGQSTVHCHRLVYGVLSEEFQAGLHALALETRAPAS